LNQEVKGGVNAPARAGPHVLGREKAVLLKQGQNPPCCDTLKHLPKCVKEGNGLLGSKNGVVPYAWLFLGDSVAVAECSGMVRQIDMGLKEGLKENNKRASKTLQDKKENAITTCCFERVRLFNHVGNLSLRN
jgi:hypothetical protein